MFVRSEESSKFQQKLDFSGALQKKTIIYKLLFSNYIKLKISGGQVLLEVQNKLQRENKKACRI